MKPLHVALLAILAGAFPAGAQDWPVKPVGMVVPFAAGARPTSSCG